MDPTLKEWQPIDFSSNVPISRYDTTGYYPVFASPGDEEPSLRYRDHHSLVFFLPTVPTPTEMASKITRDMKDLARMAYERLGAGDSAEARDILAGLIRQLDRDL